MNWSFNLLLFFWSDCPILLLFVFGHHYCIMTLCYCSSLDMLGNYMLHVLLKNVPFIVLFWSKLFSSRSSIKPNNLECKAFCGHIDKCICLYCGTLQLLQSYLWSLWYLMLRKKKVSYGDTEETVIWINKNKQFLHLFTPVPVECVLNIDYIPNPWKFTAVEIVVRVEEFSIFIYRQSFILNGIYISIRIILIFFMCIFDSLTKFGTGNN